MSRSLACSLLRGRCCFASLARACALARFRFEGRNKYSTSSLARACTLARFLASKEGRKSSNSSLLPHKAIKPLPPLSPPPPPKKQNSSGSGQVIDQGARLVDIALENKSVFSDDGFKYISESFAEHTLHFIGLLSDGGVHSRTDQLFLFIRGAAERGAKKIRVHILTDGRDVPDGSSVRFVSELEEVLKSLPDAVDAKIASGGGRMRVTMDRYEADWKIVERGWKAHVLGEAPHTFSDAKTAVETLRGSGDNAISDQWLDPFVIVDKDSGLPVGTIEDGDAVVLTNFRADRVIEISKAFEYADFTAFDRTRWPKTRFVGMMQYDGDLKLPARYLVPPPAITRVSGELLAASGVSTFACSETQKFGHVTFFWNGNRSGYFNEALETYVEIPSDAVPFNEAPDMKAREITEAGKEALLSKKYKVVRINYANPDMVRSFFLVLWRCFYFSFLAVFFCLCWCLFL